jgi:hypothetical protein
MLLASQVLTYAMLLVQFSNLEMRRWGCLQGHNVHIKFRENLSYRSEVEFEYNNLISKVKKVKLSL